MNSVAETLLTTHRFSMRLLRCIGPLALIRFRTETALRALLIQVHAYLLLDAGTSTHQTDHSPNSESSHCKGIKMVHLDAPWQSHS